jgi:putative tricarboxylic transport membrane protein
MKLFALRDFWSGVLFAGIGAAFLVLAQENSVGTAADMGPAFFPSLVAVLLIVLGLASCLRAASRPGARIEFASLRPLLIIVAATLAFGLLLQRFGLILAIGALVGISAFARPAPRPLETALLAVALMLIGGVLFVWALG